MKVSGVETGVRIYPQNPSFRSEITVPKETTVHDEFVSEGKKTKRKKLFLLTSSLIIAGLAAYLTHKAGWWEKSRDNVSRIIDENTVFKKPEEAKAYFESLGIKT